MQVDGGDAVGDDVVQVACDAQALLGDSATGFFVAALLEIMGPLLELGEIGPPVVLRGPEEYRPGDPSGERQQQRQVLGTILGNEGHHQVGDPHRRHRGECSSAVARGGDGVERKQGCEVHRTAGEAGHGVDKEAADHHREDGFWRDTAEGDGAADHDDRCDRPTVIALAAVVSGGKAEGDEERRGDRRDDTVDHPRPPSTRRHHHRSR